MEPGFVAADSNNLPEISDIMIHNFYKDNPLFVSTELQNVKTQRAASEVYGDDAVEYVQLKRINGECTIKALITPEHKVTKKGYKVTIIIDEENKKLLSCECEDCVASSGGCKHSVAVLFWAYRRSMEPSVTSVQCYWRRSRMSKIGKTIKFQKIKDIYESPTIEDNPGLLQKICCNTSSNSLLVSCFKNVNLETISLYQLALKYINFCKDNNNVTEALDFVKYCNKFITEKDCELVLGLTKGQSKNHEWYEARYGRITASKFLEAANCKTMDGVLVETILGAYKIPRTDAMTRGLALENKIILIIENKYKIKINKVGFYINKDQPIFGASPDGVSTVYCIEIKCPSSVDTVKNYYFNNKLSNKLYAQIQLQMYIFKKSKGLVCIASPEFETNFNVNIVEVNIDHKYVIEKMENATLFWCQAIFPKLL